MAVFDCMCSVVGWAALIVFVATSAWRAWQAVRTTANKATRTTASGRLTRALRCMRPPLEDEIGAADAMEAASRLMGHVRHPTHRPGREMPPEIG